MAPYDVAARILSVDFQEGVSQRRALAIAREYRLSVVSNFYNAAPARNSFLVATARSQLEVAAQLSDTPGVSAVGMDGVASSIPLLQVLAQVVVPDAYTLHGQLYLRGGTQ